MREQHEDNRKSWNKATARHNSHKGDQAKFLRDGGTTLFPEEIALLGDVRGKSLVHLQCNAGQDTLSIAQHLGANVTGVDISDEAINFARTLSAESGIAGTFVRSDVYDWFEQNTTHYDVVFASYGAIVWLSDVPTWAKGVAKTLKAGGQFVLMEFHPSLNLLYGGLYKDWAAGYDYMGGTHLVAEDGIGDYVGMSGDGLLHGDDLPTPAFEKWINGNTAHEYNWGVAEVVDALLSAGLRLSTLKEYPYSNGFMPFPEYMVAQDGRRMTLKDDMPIMPLMYGLRAEK